jgi:FimV-like protein
MMEMDDFSQAEDYLNSASKIFEKLKNQYNIADLHLLRGCIYNRKMEWEWAKEEFRTGIEGIRKIDAPLVLGRALYDVAQEYIKSGDNKGASHLLNEALVLSTESSAELLREKVKEMLGKIGA